MARRAEAGMLRGVCIVVALLASIGVGITVGFFCEKFEQKEGASMKDRIDGWLFAVLIISTIVTQRMVDQIMGINVLTSYIVEIVPNVVIDIYRCPRMIYVPIEMGMALLAVCITEYQIQRMRPGARAIIWVVGMVATASTLGMLHWQPLVVFAAIGAISLIAGLRECSKNDMAFWVELEKGIIAGCLLGGSLRYGFTFGVLAVIVAWTVQDRCLWLGTLLGALVSRAKGVGASAGR